MNVRQLGILVIFLWAIAPSLSAQEAPNQGGQLSGSFDSYGYIFVRDSAIGASNTPQYDHQLFGADAWLTLNYQNKGFDIGVRFDLFNNSNLLNRTGSYSAQGLGRWYLKKSVGSLHLAAGYLYDQIGSGIVFRAYEERALAIDNALFGVSAAYDISPDWKIKVFTGKQKKQFDTYDPIIKGAYLTGFWSNASGRLTLAPSIGMVNRTLDDETMQRLVGTLSTYTPSDSIGATFNAYATSVSNTLTYGPITWYAEYAAKTAEAIYAPRENKTNWNGTTSRGKFVNRPGTVAYTSISLSKRGKSVNVEYKRTENFTFRADPFSSLNRGLMNFLPPMTRANTYRLPARYAAATQELGEQAAQMDVNFSPTKKLSFNLNASNITDLDGLLLNREILGEVTFKRHKYQVITGFQYMNYNQEIYQEKPGVDMVQSLTPYVDFLYKFNEHTSLRTELQYMDTHQDYGSWAFALIELGVAPHWVISASDMYNIKPKKTDDIHYPTLSVAYSRDANRISLAYVKQVEGIVCSGGICRLEPAFNGYRMTVASTF